MNTKLIEKLERMIVIPNGDLKDLVLDIEHNGIKLSQPSRKKQKEKYYIVLNHLYMHHFYHKRQAKGRYNKEGTKYLPTELGNTFMRSKVGQIWDTISKNLRAHHIIQRNEDFESNSKKKPRRVGKKSDASYCGNSNNKLKRPFSMCYRLAPSLQDDANWVLGEIDTENKLDPPSTRNDDGSLYSSDITIDIDEANKDLQRHANKKNWNPLMTKIYLRKVVLFNHRPLVDKVCSTGRVFNKVNCLPSVIRKHIRIKGIQMQELDIKSCLANILYTYIEDSDEQDQWKKHILHKRLYMFFAVQCHFITKEGVNKCASQQLKKEYREAGIDRAKLAVCCYLGGRRRQDSKLVDSVLKEHFPILHNTISEIEASSPNKGELSRLLQRIESNIVVKGMSDECYTTISIHDGVGVAIHHIHEAYTRMHQLFEKHVGCPCVITGFDPSMTNKQFS